MSCPTGKRIYGGEKWANRAVDKAISRGEMPPLRGYPCAECGYWHLSTNWRLCTKVRYEDGMVVLAHGAPLSRKVAWQEAHQRPVGRWTRIWRAFRTHIGCIRRDFADD